MGSVIRDPRIILGGGGGGLNPRGSVIHGLPTALSYGSTTLCGNAIRASPLSPSVSQ